MSNNNQVGTNGFMNNINVIPEVSSEELLEMEILCNLNNEGFNISDVGTIIYKELILRIIGLYKANAEDTDILIQNPYSEVYTKLSNEIGIEPIELHKQIIKCSPTKEYKKSYIRKAKEMAKTVLGMTKDKPITLKLVKNSEYV